MPMKLIKVGKTHSALIDDEDFDVISQYRWFWNGRYAYTRNPSGSGVIMMHRLIFKTKLKVDHINGNGLDNRKINLRPCNHSQNMQNQSKHKNNRSGIKGVYLNKWAKNKRFKKIWEFQLIANGRRMTKKFPTKEEAAEAYRLAAIEFHGQFARID